MTQTVRKVTFRPEVGERINIPTKIGRIDVDRIGSPDWDYGTLTVTVVGEGDVEEYIVLRTPDNEAEIKEGAQILCGDPAKDAVWYCVKTSAYGVE